ncbi:hypothetical protein [Saccharothrix coeruleofusca]|uniref:hypothetical protein n=1 Tax=Saccharothrix coeruleofusca TaxID=33919 RepID=UPI00167005D7|nr:hypothetical protein [Saccharothrix coeruleofusca]MBP2336010.1 phenylalanyl-tRNA synthetase beta subunit [Saccharothrix coeruleofusca]
MRVPLAWLDDLCGRRVDRSHLAGWLRAAGAQVGEIDDARGAAVEVLAPPGLGHLTSVLGLAAEIRGRLGQAADERAAGALPVDPPVLRADFALLVEPAPARLAAAAVVLPGPVEVPGPQAEWLTAAGVRLTGTVADVLAFVQLETGQPVHAAEGTLDGLALRTNAEGEVVVAAGDQVLAVPGKGAAELPRNCREVVVYSWWLPPEAMRQVLRTAGRLDGTGQRLACGLPSAGCDLAVARVVELVTAWARGEVKATAAGGVTPAPRPVFTIGEAELRAIIAPDVDVRAAATLLSAAGVPAVVEHGALRVSPPFWREDLTCARMVAGEVARLRGYRSIPVRLPAWDRVPSVDPARQLRRTLRDVAVRWGLQQVTTPVLWPSSSDLPSIDPTGVDPMEVRGRTGLRNLRVRDSLLPAVLDVATRSLEHTGAAHHFEIGPVPRSARPGDEQWRMTAVLGGALLPPSLVDPEPRAVTFADLVGLVGMLGAGRGEPELVPAERSVFDPSFTVLVGGERVGRAGVFGPQLFCVDLDLGALQALPLVRRSVRPVPQVPLPAFNVTVDLAPGQQAREVLDLVAEAGMTRRDLVRVRDVYQGERIGHGRTSLTIRAEFDMADATGAKAEGRRRREAVLAAARGRGWDCR